MPFALVRELPSEQETVLRNGNRNDVARLSAAERQDLLFRLVARIDGTLNFRVVGDQGRRDSTFYR